MTKKKMISLILGATMTIGLLAGCGAAGSSGSEGAATGSTQKVEQTEETTSEAAPAETTAASETAAEEQSADTSEGGKTLVVYYSAQGHTVNFANAIAEELNADIFELTPVNEYGGTRENRLRFVMQVYCAVREAVGAEYPVWIKLDSTDGYADGISVEDFVWTSKQLADAGMNAIEVSGMVQPRFYQYAYYREAAEKAAEQITADVIVTGGIRTIEDVRGIAKESKAQFFGMSRPFLVHPDYVLQLKAEHEM